MYDLVIFLLGSVLTLAVAAVVVHLRRGRGDRDDSTGTAVIDNAPPARYEISLGDTETVAQIAEGIGGQLADLATGVEGHAQLLCEVIGEPAQVANQAQRLWSAVRKLRLFSEKVLHSSRRPVVDCAPTGIRSLLTSLHQELEEYSGAGLRVTCEIASSLPQASADRDALRKAVLFLVDAMLELETNAAVVGLRASTRVDDDDAPSVEIEIQAQSEDAPQSQQPHRRSFALGYAAARNLTESLGASLWLEHCPGLCSTARVHLAAAEPDASPAPAPSAPSTRVEHPFGGILIVEDEASVRAVVAREMEKTGRRIFSCPDGAAARSLLLATPERFELLILDGGGRRQSGAKLAREALSWSPELKILWLRASPQPDSDMPDDLGDRGTELHKPFGIIELREAVTRMLGTSAAPQIAS